MQSGPSSNGTDWDEINTEGDGKCLIPPNEPSSNGRKNDNNILIGKEVCPIHNTYHILFTIYHKSSFDITGCFVESHGYFYCGGRETN